jgi:hypothetical protein
MKPSFTIRRSHSGTYGDLIIHVYPDFKEFSPRAAHITFQSNRNTEWDYYAGRITIPCVDNLSQLERLNRALKSILKPAHNPKADYFISDAAVIIQTFLDAKIPQVVYDERESELVLLDHVKPPTFHAWRDDFNSHGGPGCYVGCLAENEADAQRLLTINFAQAGSSAQDAFNKWIVAGRKVMRLDRETPDVTPAADVLKWILTMRQQAALPIPA